MRATIGFFAGSVAGAIVASLIHREYQHRKRVREMKVLYDQYILPMFEKDRIEVETEFDYALMEQ